MSTRKHLLALGGSLLMGFASVTQAGTPGTNDLAAEVSALRARIAQLEGRQSDAWMNERRAEEVKSLVREVLADADTRASLLAEGATAGHDNGHFWIGSADGSFLLQISGLIQVRHTWNNRDGDNDDLDTNDNNEAGFEIPRAKVKFAGHISSPRIGYALRLAVDRDSNDVWADQILISYCLADNLWILAGEDKLPFLREELTEPEHQLAVDRSLVNEVFTAGRGQGLWLKWHATDMIHVSAAISDGFRSGERMTDGSKAFYADSTDFAVTGRVDVKLAGEWAQMDDFTAWSGQPFAAFLGAAVHWEEGETGDDFDNDNFFAWTVDGSLEVSGLNLFAAVVGLHTDFEFGDDVDLYGYVVQGGYQIIPDKFEIFARWEMLDLDDLDIDDIHLITLGGNWYINKHQTKLTVDVVWALDEIPSGVSALTGPASGLTTLGLLTDADGEEDQVALRTQVTVTW